MRILSQTKDISGYHGTIGTPTNMYDYGGNQLFVGDVVGLTTCGIDGKKAYDYGIEFVCQEDINIARWTGKNYQYVMGIANAYNNINFNSLNDIELNTDEWWEKFEEIDPDFRVFKVNDWATLVEGETIGFLSVVDIESEDKE